MTLRHAFDPVANEVIWTQNQESGIIYLGEHEVRKGVLKKLMHCSRQTKQNAGRKAELIIIREPCEQVTLNSGSTKAQLDRMIFFAKPMNSRVVEKIGIISHDLNVRKVINRPESPPAAISFA